MSVNINQDYNVFQSGYYGRTARSKSRGAQRTDKATEADQAGKTTQLSAKAKSLLEDLKKKYGNVDIMVADYDTEEEAQDILARGTKEFSALFDTETLEKMAADEDVKKEYMDKLDGAINQLGEMAKKLGDKSDEVKHMGVSFGDDGSVSYFAELEKSSQKQRERIEQSRADKKEQAAEEKKAEAKKAAEEGRLAGSPGTVKTTRVKADTAEELLEKIRNVDWDQIKASEVFATGGRFDLTV